jgi:RHS repeat-associated protein
LIDHFTADVVTAQDYYPFGMIMPGRSFVAASGGNYRYGFNGKENDNEVKGVGDQQDYGMRIYDPRVGRFLSVDPITYKYPELTPYQFSSNSPIANVDWDGGESKYYSANLFDYLSKGNVILAKTTMTKVEETGVETGVRGMFHIGHGPLGKGTRTDFYLTETKVEDGQVTHRKLYLGYAYEPAADADAKEKARGGFYFTSKKGMYTHADGDIDEGDGTPISLDLLVSALGSGSDGETEEQEFEKLLTDRKVANVVVEALEKVKTVIESGGRAVDIKEAFDAMAEDNEKEKQEEENPPAGPSSTVNIAVGKPAIFKRDDNIGHERKGSVSNGAYTGDKVDSIKKDTFYVKQGNK